MGSFDYSPKCMYAKEYYTYIFICNNSNNNNNLTHSSCLQDCRDIFARFNLTVVCLALFLTSFSLEADIRFALLNQHVHSCVLPVTFGRILFIIWLTQKKKKKTSPAHENKWGVNTFATFLGRVCFFKSFFFLVEVMNIIWCMRKKNEAFDPVWVKKKWCNLYFLVIAANAFEGCQYLQNWF